MSRWRLAALGTAGTGVAYLGLRTAFDDHFDLYNVGAARFGRAALTVASISLDYRRSIYTKDSAALYESNRPEYDAVRSACHQRSAERLLKLACDNGGVFVKVAQHIGALDYLLPQEYVQTCKVTHHNAPEQSIDDVLTVMRAELKKEPSEIFSSFDEQPLGTASLAQVHRATLKSDGREVAVKVQHLKVKQNSIIDMWTMEFLANTVKLFFPGFGFMWLVEETKRNLPLELDFAHEGCNSEMVGKLLQGHSWLKVPEIEWDLTTDRVLTMEYCDGVHIDDRDAVIAQGIDPQFVSECVGKMYADMIFKFGYVHCDPHPGNVLVKKDPVTGRPQIVLLDHGLYTQLTNKFRLDYTRLWTSALRSDIEGLKHYSEVLGVGPLYELFACMVTGRSWGSITTGIAQETTAGEANEIKQNAQKYVVQIADVLANVNRQMLLIFKTNDLLRAMEHTLGTQNAMAGFVQMSRSCVRCLSQEEVRKAKTTSARIRATLSAHWADIRISAYELFLWFRNTIVGRALKIGLS